MSEEAGHCGRDAAQPALFATSSTAMPGGVPGKTLPKIDVLQQWVQDEAWSGKPFWMLNVLKFKGDAGRKRYDDYGRHMERDVLPTIGAKIVLAGYARTVVGRISYDRIAIVQYPSPQVFMQMAASHGKDEAMAWRLEGLAEQYLIPLGPGWFHIDRPAPPPSQPLVHYTVENVLSVPNGMLGNAVEGARVGVTSATEEQLLAFVKDPVIGGSDTLWHLNLLGFGSQEQEQSYGHYTRAMGGKEGGVLASFGARSTLASDCYRSLMGDVDFQRAIIAEYPSRDSFLSMGSSQRYLEVASLRHKGLEETYIVSCVPQLLDKHPG